MIGCAVCEARMVKEDSSMFALKPFKGRMHRFLFRKRRPLCKEKITI